MAACTMLATSASAQSAKDIRGPSPLVAIANAAPAKLTVDRPLAEQLAPHKVLIELADPTHRVIPPAKR